jgi:DNA polymerase-3 subunit epsilon
MVVEFDLHLPFCFMVKMNTESVIVACKDSSKKYNVKVLQAISELDSKLLTYAVMEPVVEDDKVLCLLVEKGSFWGMGYLDQADTTSNIEQLKNTLVPYRDNNFIRNSLNNYVAEHPEKVLRFEKC